MFLLGLTLLLSGVKIFAADFKSNSACAVYLKQLERVLTDRRVAWEFPSAHLKKHFPDNSYPETLKAFEDDLQKLYLETPPGAREWPSFAKRWELTESEALDVRSFYGLYFFDYPGIVGDRNALIDHVKAKSFVKFLNDAKTRAAQQHQFYRDNVGRLSVPEMARELGISEGLVYRDLPLLGISLTEHYAKNPKIYDAATQAGSFSRHAANLENRGVGWNRIFDFRGKPLMETEILVQLFDEGKSYKEIAKELNQLAGTLTAGHSDIRTEQAISAKIQDLGLAQVNRLREPNIVMEPYGFVKQRGGLVARGAIEFILDHKHMPIEWLANRLGVQDASLKRFLQVQHLEGIVKGEAADGAPLRTFRVSPLIKNAEEVERIATKLRENDQAMLGLQRAMAANEGKFPVYKIKSAEGIRYPFNEALNIREDKFFGRAEYAVDAPLGHLRLNDSKLEAYERTLARLETNTELGADQKDLVRKTLRAEIEALKFDSLPLAAQNEIVIKRFHQAIVAHKGKIPPYNHIKGVGSPLANVLGIDVNKFFGNGTFADGKSYADKRLNASRAEAVQRSLDRVADNGALDPTQKELITKTLQKEIEDLQFEALPLPEQNEVIIKRLHQAIVANKGSFPRGKNNLNRVLGMDAVKFYGQTTYSDGGKLAHLRLNNSHLDAMEQSFARVDRNPELDVDQKEIVKKALKEEIESLKFEALPLTEQNEIVIGRLHQAIVENYGKIPAINYPKESDSLLSKVLGVNPYKFFGMLKYAEGDELGHLRLNNSRLEAIERSLARVDSNPRLKPEQQDLVRKALMAEVENIKFEALSLPEQNEIVIKRLHKAIVDKKGLLPRGDFDLLQALGVTPSKFFGTGDYAKGNKNGDTQLNGSRMEATERSLARVANNPALDAVQKELVKRALTDELESVKFDALPPIEQNNVVIRRLHKAIVDNQGQIPSSSSRDPSAAGSPLSRALGIDQGKFLGTSNYADGKISTHKRLNESRLQAMERTLALLEKNEDLNDDERLIVRSALEKEIQKLKK